MIKTRFAPSPTGYLHVGGLRTALYAYLFAKKNNGKFILRIEDTDQKRFVEGATENLINTLKWAGLEYDEGPNIDGSDKGDFGPYTQSKRTEIYKEYAEKLIESGHAYRCFCTKERLDEMREQQLKNKEAPMYDRHCCDLPESEIQANLSEGKVFVVRQKIPYELIKFKDLIRGNVQFHGKTIDDQVLVKSDGFPTYHLANVVDDHLMGITHVIRAEEWLPSTPKHIALYHSFGWKVPEFAHLPLLLNDDRSKLSKRQGDVAVEEYIKKGYLQEAVINFVVFLGWNPGSGNEQEIFNMQELTEIFDLEKVHKAGAVFNLEKLDWFNWRWLKEKFNEKIKEIAKNIDSNVEISTDKKGQLITNFSNNELEEKFLLQKGEELLKIVENNLEKKYLNEKELLLKSLNTVEEKILKNPKEINEHISFIFQLPEYHHNLLTQKKMRVNLEQAVQSIEESRKALKKIDNWTQNAIRDELVTVIENLSIKNGQLLWPLRVALSGQEFSPGAFEIAWAIGKEETLNRLNKALEKI